MSPLSNRELGLLCQTAKKAALSAGEYIQSQFDKHYTQQLKAGGGSLASQVVTEVDFMAEKMILDQLQSSRTTYDLGLLTEETPDDQSRVVKDYFWCIDPMDGTLPFTEHRSGYAVSIALISKSGDPVIGVVYIPDLRLCYSSVSGEGVWINNEPFTRTTIASDNTLHFYMDRGFQSERHAQLVKTEMNKWADEHQIANISYHTDFGGVRNAVSTMTSATGGYFKFSKKQKGGGSIWDFAATRLFFEELGFPVSNAQGEKLHLNKRQTTFMNDQGVIYATDKELSEYIVQLGRQVEALREIK